MTKSEIEKQKSLALAELSGWNPSSSSDGIFISCMPPWSGGETLCPYVKSQQGYAQFAAILLKFPEVVPRMCKNKWHKQGMQNVSRIELRDANPTKEIILDEILRMKGKWQEEWND